MKIKLNTQTFEVLRNILTTLHNNLHELSELHNNYTDALYNQLSNLLSTNNLISAQIELDLEVTIQNSSLLQNFWCQHQNSFSEAFVTYENEAEQIFFNPEPTHELCFNISEEQTVDTTIVLNKHYFLAWMITQKCIVPTDLNFSHKLDATQIISETKKTRAPENIISDQSSRLSLFSQLPNIFDGTQITDNTLLPIALYLETSSHGIPSLIFKIFEMELLDVPAHLSRPFVLKVDDTSVKDTRNKLNFFLAMKMFCNNYLSKENTAFNLGKFNISLSISFPEPENKRIFKYTFEKLELEVLSITAYNRVNMLYFWNKYANMLDSSIDFVQCSATEKDFILQAKNLSPEKTATMKKLGQYADNNFDSLLENLSEETASFLLDIDDALNQKFVFFLNRITNKSDIDIAHIYFPICVSSALEILYEEKIENQNNIDTEEVTQFINKQIRFSSAMIHILSVANAKIAQIISTATLDIEQSSYYKHQILNILSVHFLRNSYPDKIVDAKKIEALAHLLFDLVGKNISDLALKNSEEKEQLKQLILNNLCAQCLNDNSNIEAITTENITQLTQYLITASQTLNLAFIRSNSGASEEKEQLKQLILNNLSNNFCTQCLNDNQTQQAIATESLTQLTQHLITASQKIDSTLADFSDHLDNKKETHKNAIAQHKASYKRELLNISCDAFIEKIQHESNVGNARTKSMKVIEKSMKQKINVAEEKFCHAVFTDRSQKTQKCRGILTALATFLVIAVTGVIPGLIASSLHYYRYGKFDLFSKTNSYKQYKLAEHRKTIHEQILATARA